MLKMILKGSFILALPVIALNLYASASPSKEVLAKQCHELSDTVASLVSSQQKSICIDKLVFASLKIESAGSLILDDSVSTAKEDLDHAVYTLQYAELNSCNRYIQISHSKFEAQRIKNAL